LRRCLPVSTNTAIPGKKLQVTSSTNNSPRPGDDRSVPSHSLERLGSLDVMRGFVVAGMILVNFSMLGAGFRKFAVYPVLAHADWVGFTVADFVFPAFIFIIGVSIALASRASQAFGARTAKRIVSRSIRLFFIGFVLTNLLYQWMHGWSFDGGFRLMGVLQRISLCYAAAALLQHRLSDRALLGVAIAILVLYWPLTLVPIPDGSGMNLWTEGTNFVSWFDRRALGAHRWVEGPTGYDTEGILSTLPALAQCLLGVLAGRWFVGHAKSTAHLVRFAMLGALMVGCGYVWGFWFPIVKSLWTSSFVILSTGLAMLLLATIQGAMATSRCPTVAVKFFSALGVNAILAYVLHFLCYFGLALPFIPSLYLALGSALTPELANLSIACIFVFIVWCPLAVMFSHGWHLRV
jgi:predicted acyltransferase